MRQVSGCDFCGDTASGTFDVLPPEYDPEGKGKRMVLCDHCRDALASILDPLLETKSGRDGELSAAGDEPELTGEPDVSPGDDSEGSTADTDASAAAEPDQESASESERNAESRMAKTGAGTSSRVPKGYRKTLRFLENREMPIERESAVELVSDAYGLEEDSVEAAIDHAANHGRLKVLEDEIHLS